MSTKFYIKDDNGIYLSVDGKTRYSMLEGDELYMFLMSEEGKKRSFHVDTDENGDKIGIEGEPNKVREMDKIKRRERYLNTVKLECNVTFVSGNTPVEDTDYAELFDTIEDETQDLDKMLTDQGIGIFFEKESINTLRMSDELMLSTFSAIAQEESIAISQRLRHANLERMKRGEYIAGTCPFGYRLVDKKLTIYEPEAEIVREIFFSYLSGASINELARDMTAKQVQKRKDTDWHYITIYYILTNEKYMGDTLFQKTYKTDTLPFEKKKNNGEKDQYYATGSHEPIIDRETFEAVQELLKAKAKYFGTPNPTKPYPLSKRIRCRECGAYFIRRTNKGKTIWSCYNHERSKENCQAKRYREEDIYGAYLRMFNKLYHYRQPLLRQTLTHIDYVIKYKKKNNPTIKAYNQSIADLLDKKVMLEGLRQKGYLTEEMYYTQCKEIDRLMKETKVDRAILYDSELEGAYSNIKGLYDIVESYGKEMTSFDAELFDKIICDTAITADGTIEFTLTGGLKLAERL